MLKSSGNPESCQNGNLANLGVYVKAEPGVRLADAEEAPALVLESGSISPERCSAIPAAAASRRLKACAALRALSFVSPFP